MCYMPPVSAWRAKFQKLVSDPIVIHMVVRPFRLSFELALSSNGFFYRDWP